MTQSGQNRELAADMRGFFTDTTAEYLSPEEPAENSPVTIRFRVPKRRIKMITMICNRIRVPMVYLSSEKYFDYYTCTYLLCDKRIYYYFEIVTKNSAFYYDVRGVVEKSEEAFQFQIIPGFSTPKWAKGAVFYQIYVDRFCNGDESNDVLNGEYKYMDRLTEKKADWYLGTSDTGVGEFYGGDLKGVMDKLDYLQELGIDVIYFNPLFVSPSNHKYDIQDYDHIDPHFGKLAHDKGDLLQDEKQENLEATRYIDRVTNTENLSASDALFIELVAEAHKRGMKVILDGVFNHCGSFNKWMDREGIYEQAGREKGAYSSEKSPYRDYFYFSSDKWPKNDSYEGWWDYNTLPKLNYDSLKLYDYTMKVARKWVSAPYCADGWRLDVAADLGKTPEKNHKFWQDFRKNVKEANPNALILAEHYGDPSAWMNGKEWDSVMNYDAFMEPVTWFLTGMEKHSDEYRQDLLGDASAFWASMHAYMAKFTNSSLSVAMNELSNHDHSRFLTRTSHKVGRITTMGAKAADEGNNEAVMRTAVIMQMTWPGAPTLYYGDEAGVCGFTDPDNRRTYPWGRENKNLLAFHKAAIQIHKEQEELKSGSLIPLVSEDYYLVYGRKKANESCVIIINNGDSSKEEIIPVWELGIPNHVTLKRLICSTKDNFTEENEEVNVKNGTISLCLPAYSSMIYKYDGKKKSLFSKFPFWN